MTTQDQGQASGIRLQCCGGNPVPQVVSDGWKKFLALPEGARGAIWELLGHTILVPDDPANESRVQGFCAAHKADTQDIVEAVRSCDYLIRNASALNLASEVLEKDLLALSSGDSEGPRIVLARFDSAKAELRKMTIEDSLADHGKLLVGLDWRVDNVTASDRGAQLDSPVVFLTLRYREFDSVERLTLQLTPEAVQQLRGFVDRFGS